MKRQEALKTLDIAIHQDRERFFKIADSLHYQPKYAAHMDELEAVAQQWRDITKMLDYPNIDFPLPLPEWFPDWQFMKIVKDVTLSELQEE